VGCEEVSLEPPVRSTPDTDGQRVTTNSDGTADANRAQEPPSDVETALLALKTALESDTAAAKELRDMCAASSTQEQHRRLEESTPTEAAPAGVDDAGGAAVASDTGAVSEAIADDADESQAAVEPEAVSDSVQAVGQAEPALAVPPQSDAVDVAEPQSGDLSEQQQAFMREIEALKAELDFSLSASEENEVEAEVQRDGGDDEPVHVTAEQVVPLSQTDEVIDESVPRPETPDTEEEEVVLRTSLQPASDVLDGQAPAGAVVIETSTESTPPSSSEAKSDDVARVEPQLPPPLPAAPEPKPSESIPSPVAVDASADLAAAVQAASAAYMDSLSRDAPALGEATPPTPPAAPSAKPLPTASPRHLPTVPKLKATISLPTVTPQRSSFGAQLLWGEGDETVTSIIPPSVLERSLEDHTVASQLVAALRESASDLLSAVPGGVDAAAAVSAHTDALTLVAMDTAQAMTDALDVMAQTSAELTAATSSTVLNSMSGLSQPAITVIAHTLGASSAAELENAVTSAHALAYNIVNCAPENADY